MLSECLPQSGVYKYLVNYWMKESPQDMGTSLRLLQPEPKEKETTRSLAVSL